MAVYAFFFYKISLIPQMPVVLQWIQWICPMKYGLNLLLIYEFGDVHPIGDYILSREESPHLPLLNLDMMFSSNAFCIGLLLM